MSSLQRNTLLYRLQCLLQERPHSEAVVAYDEELQRSSWTYQELFNIASRFAHILKMSGVKKGDYVLSSLPNCPEAVVTTLGVMLAGAVHVPVEVFMNSGETFFDVAERTRAKYMIVSDSELDHNSKLIASSIEWTASSITGLFKGDNPKLKHLQTMFRIERSVRDSVSCEDNYLNCGPTSWLTSSPGDYLVWRSTRVLLDSWHPLKVKSRARLLAEIIKKEKVGTVFLTPIEVEDVVREWCPRMLPMSKHLITGGMPVTEKLINSVQPAFTKVTLRYGITETGDISTNTIESGSTFKSFDCGTCIRGVQVRLVDADFKDVAPGQTGQWKVHGSFLFDSEACKHVRRLLFKSPGMFGKYVGQPECETLDKFTSDGWFISGDAGCKQMNGHLFVMGRSDTMILHNTFNIHPSWLEKDLRTHPAVKEVVVVPVPDEVNFQNICACVLRHEGSDANEEDILNHYRDIYVAQEGDMFSPNYVLFFDSFPVQRNGQTDRSQLAEQATATVQTSKLAKIATNIVKHLTDFNEVH
ncbi:3-[(3aS 4S 7aS)-7a-methyl-1 5-dioxo-octahydro-1H-inden-4-yl]propanoyl:CoA ligase [Biomphalaria pfeifferi]|uniref:3-[(3aS 4S 7aS)-7a-methyl-1 5-dioxo-octahydro-1H-inden-4-yl]propanoyl:CoA ligase n=1 Tax=Biomphalaria pfeifferi TaxID=112525 RepID=A0AAD8BSJ6_BIOPF|nr:3-[(3aS 4S 7aS)-7a-methyl-1 5-dioxo-octahydro-1H-inden-4-yl]propanoyl:CoA ligase [Biomphalaria pfeifferi]